MFLQKGLNGLTTLLGHVTELARAVIIGNDDKKACKKVNSIAATFYSQFETNTT